jgi:hypothetical protein
MWTIDKTLFLKITLVLMAWLLSKESPYHHTLAIYQTLGKSSP